jgi:ubiquinone/menaquinone biosynthesis C-methylase UbiE
MNPSQIAPGQEAIHELVRQGYGKIAWGASAGCCNTDGTCCGSSTENGEKLARELGYTIDELQALPEGANMGLSCGNPAALAALKPGEVVLDLGSGGGFDVFIAGRKVGATGRAIGIDMTPDMLAKARRNVDGYRQQTGLDNVEFRLGEIEHLPVPDASVDAIISNCVINLSPDKPQVWREIARVLKPGGRVAVSDIALLKPLPPDVLRLVEAVVGCVAGAVLVDETERMAQAAGLTDIVLNPKPQYIEAMTTFKDPLYQKIVQHLPEGTKPSEFITSLEVCACKPASDAAPCCAAKPVAEAKGEKCCA